ncbi:aromatic ring-hydroxylating dioxygenase subunit alpha [Paucibacter sp. R3-3]|uniref:Aromatic ring-hydroxylating dioxygenase subunit alpha n=1 Tax=Roseateles agri TaxID=3098619 RepID=A0ABU5DQ65_9BURK|nr:aromatic ring-hydroxylating dioxygenase subunit alpha [Paucibacter sp. R3-3]MDY0748254.1 aromatic ring-hydroxylating dioxygenase subunit alpha [Paucibacter sp. R3-3]
MSGFNTIDPNMLGDWLTVGPATRLDHGAYETKLLGSRVRLWRDEAGQLQACAADGRTLQAQQRYGYLWVCAGEGAEPRPLFDFPEFDEPGRRIVDCDGIGVNVSGLRMVENFLDMAHFPYVHSHYLGEVPHTEVAPYKVSIDEEADEIWATECRFYQPRTSGSATEGVEAQYRYRVMQPMTAMLYKTSVPRPGAQDAIGLFVQPVDEEHIIAYCLLAYFEDTLSDTELIAFQHTIFGQDKPILENQMPKKMPLVAGMETPTRCDAMSGAYRRWLRKRGMSYGAIA